MTLTPETLDRLEAHARAQHDKLIATGIIVNPGLLLELLRGYREQSQEASPPATEPTALIDANGESPL